MVFLTGNVGLDHHCPGHLHIIPMNSSLEKLMLIFQKGKESQLLTTLRQPSSLTKGAPKSLSVTWAPPPNALHPCMQFKDQVIQASNFQLIEGP